MSNKLIAENKRLHKENKELKEKVAFLEKTLIDGMKKIKNLTRGSDYQRIFGSNMK